MFVGKHKKGALITTTDPKNQKNETRLVMQKSFLFFLKISIIIHQQFFWDYTTKLSQNLLMRFAEKILQRAHAQTHNTHTTHTYIQTHTNTNTAVE